jgi:hypothetical protein
MGTKDRHFDVIERFEPSSIYEHFINDLFGIREVGDKWIDVFNVFNRLQYYVPTDFFIYVIFKNDLDEDTRTMIDLLVDPGEASMCCPGCCCACTGVDFTSMLL